MKAPQSITIVTISAFLFISPYNRSVEANDHESRTERHYNVGKYDKEVEVEHIIITRKKYRDPHPTSHHRVHRHLPEGYHTIHVKDRRYYYHKGSYYRSCRGGYEIVEAPRVRYLPQHSRKVIVNHSTYYIYDKLYYQLQGGFYVVCEPPPPPPPSKPRYHKKDRDPSVRLNIGIDISN